MTQIVPAIWMFCSRTSMNKLNNIPWKVPTPITNDYDSNFNELVESSHELSNHKTCINYLIIEVCNIRLFGSENPRSVLDATHRTNICSWNIRGTFPLDIPSIFGKSSL